MTVDERFWSKVKKAKGCWLWTGAPLADGYGGFGFEGKSVRAHRMAAVLTGTKIPAGMHVLHKCDTPLCVRPSHLYVGTQADNSRDRVDRGRQARGETQGLSRLTAKRVLKIRRLHAGGRRSMSALAAEFRVCKTSIWNVVSRKTWKHV